MGHAVKRLKTVLVLAGLLLGGSAMAGVPDWTMSESSGQVMVASSGMVRAASRGATLSPGDVIATGPKGRAVIVRGQEYLVVAPNSRIRVADPVKSGGMTQIVEQIGNVVFKIKKMATPHFAVETPFLAAVVKGTTFSVTVTEAGASVQVIEGRVEVETRDGGARYLVLPGDIGSVSGKALGRLNVQGRETKTLVSPNGGTVATAPTAEILQADPVSTEAVRPTVIASAVTEPPVRLDSATGGIVSGALVAFTATTAERDTGPASKGRAADAGAAGEPAGLPSSGGSSSVNSGNGNANGASNGDGDNSAKGNANGANGNDDNSEGQRERCQQWKRRQLGQWQHQRCQQRQWRERQQFRQWIGRQ